MPLPSPRRYDHSREELAGILKSLGAKEKFRVDQLWHGLYTEFSEPSSLTVFSAKLRESTLAEPRLAAALEEVTRRTSDHGDTVKFLWKLIDGHAVETVLMKYSPRHTKENVGAHEEAPGRVTVCVSTQAGCAMGCGFCATGQAGFDRNLTVGEIVEQVAMAAREAAPHRVSNIVFMGMGEPLANDTAVWGAIERLHQDFGISARHITVSTVGMVPGIKRLATRPLPVNLAVSLHAANDRKRDDLVPINKRYPLRELEAACEQWTQSHNRRLSFEWAMIAGTNDTNQDAQELAAIALRLRAHVNLIPLNPTPGWPTVGSSHARVQQFRDLLEGKGVNATIRANRGTDIDAACGQLRTNTINLTDGESSPVSLSPTRS